MRPARRRDPPARAVRHAGVLWAGQRGAAAGQRPQGEAPVPGSSRASQPARGPAKARAAGRRSVRPGPRRGARAVLPGQHEDPAFASASRCGSSSMRSGAVPGDHRLRAGTVRQQRRRSRWAAAGGPSWVGRGGLGTGGRPCGPRPGPPPQGFHRGRVQQGRRRLAPGGPGGRRAPLGPEQGHRDELLPGTSDGRARGGGGRVAVSVLSVGRRC